MSAIRRPPPPPKVGQSASPPSIPSPTIPTPPGPKPSERGLPPKPFPRTSIASSPSPTASSPSTPPNPGRPVPPKPFGAGRTAPPPGPKPKEETKGNGETPAEPVAEVAQSPPEKVSSPPEKVSPPTLPPKLAPKLSVSAPTTPLKSTPAPPKPVIRPPPAVKKEEPVPSVEPLSTPVPEEERPTTPVTPTKAPVPLKPPPATTSPTPNRPSIASSTGPPIPISRPSSATIPNVTVGTATVSLGGGILGQNPSEGKFSGKGLLEMPDLKALSSVQVAKAFVRSEEAYLKLGLQCVTMEFEMRLNAHIKLSRPILTQEEVGNLFLNIDNIYDFNKQLYHELENIENQGDEVLLAGLGAAMKKYIPFFKLYQKYVEKHRENANLFNRWYKKRDNFRYFVELNELCSGQKLKTLLSAPVTRLAQYLIFLGNVHEKLEKDSSGYLPLEDAIRSIQTVTDEIAEKLRDGKARELCVKVQTEIFKGAVDVLSPTRLVNKVGDLNLVGEKAKFGKGRVLTPHCFVLFNDCLLFGIRGGKLSAGKPKGVCRLDNLTISEVPDDVKMNVQHAFELKHPHFGQLLVCAASAQDKSKWITEVEKGIAWYTTAKQSSGIASKEVVSDDDFEQFITKKKAQHKTYAPISFSATGTLKGPITIPTGGSGGPSAPGGGPLWEKKLDPASGVYYYENQVTYESQWEPPPGWVDPDGAHNGPTTGGGGGGGSPPPPGVDVPEAPALAMDAPPPPEMESAPDIATDTPSAPPPSTPSETKSGGGGGGGGGAPDLLSSIRSAGGVGGLKRAPPPQRAPPKEEPKADLQATLQKSLANYRQFVQDDDEDGGDEDGDWDA